MSRALDVLVASPDPLLCELLSGLFKQEGLSAEPAGDLSELIDQTTRFQAQTVLFDLTDGGDAFGDALRDPDWALSGTCPSLLVLAGSCTPPALLTSASIDRVLSAPFQAAVVLHAVRGQLDARPRRAMSSGVQLRVEADGAVAFPEETHAPAEPPSRQVG